jgi:hypothetical protein
MELRIGQTIPALCRDLFFKEPDYRHRCRNGSGMGDFFLLSVTKQWTKHSRALPSRLCAIPALCRDLFTFDLKKPDYFIDAGTGPA